MFLIGSKRIPEADQKLMLENNWFANWNKLKQPKPPLLRNIIYAFLFGGLVSILGQALLVLYLALGVSQEQAGNPMVATVIFIASLLTAIGVFDRVSNIAGAGLAIPVTGFANSVTAMAMEFKREGLVLGTGAKMFSLAGPVIMFGVVTAFIIGIISALI